MNIAIIPARGGSKRIPRKNIKYFGGKPIIAWSIEAAISAGVFDMVMVSTDDEEIAKIARLYGAEAPFIRPAELSSDYVGITEVVAHAVNWYHKQGIEVQAACCIYATAPFIQSSDLIEGLNKLNSGNWAYSFAATEFASPIFRSFSEIEGGGVEMLFPDLFNTRSQDLPIALHDAAQFCWGRAKAWLDNERVFGASSTPLRIPNWRVVDIDTADDWKRAEYMFRSIGATI